MLELSLPIGHTWGAGVMGSNLAQAMVKLTPIRLLCDVGADHPLARYRPADWSPAVPYRTDAPMLHLARGGASFLPINPTVRSTTRNVGWAFIEFPMEARRHVHEVWEHYDQVVASSTWCASELKQMGLENVAVAIQGIDFERFHPDATVRPKDDGRFLIYSGGKAEYRKSTDVVIAAFAVLAKKHPALHLVCAWGNHWIETMNSLSRSRLIRYIPTLGKTWREKIIGTMAMNGIERDRYTLLDLIPNDRVADVYRSCHMGVFLSRCEAGNNMVLSEFLACGRPVVATLGTGHSDVVNADNCFPVAAKETEEHWIEPELESVIAQIENVYSNYEEAMKVGIRGAESVRGLTWEKCAKDLSGVCGG